jgi:hypothetical protein
MRTTTGRARGCLPLKAGGCHDDEGYLSPSAAVRDYRTRFRHRGQAELDQFSRFPTLREAIRAAAKSEDEDGKRYSHQRRSKRRAIQEATTELLGAIVQIERCADFDELFGVVESTLAETPGIGELFIYDVALRVGAWLNLSPDRVYLHRGTRDGAKALGLDTSNGTVERSKLPQALRAIPASEVEDILCIYKARFSRHS